MADKKSLKVYDADATHVGRNIVTLDKQTKDFLKISSGDIIEIEGSKKTAAIVWPAKTIDEGRSIIRMDHYIRHNAGVSLGDTVNIKKADSVEAKEVTLAPVQEIRVLAAGFGRILKKNYLGRPLTQGDTIWISVFGSGFVYRVVDTKPRGVVKITDFTNFILKEKPVKNIESIPSIAYGDIGGLSEEIQKVRDMVELPMRHPKLFSKLGITPPKGVLLHGPPGTGKTLLAKAVAHETKAHFIRINAPEIMSKFVGEAEERVRQIFKEAEENTPAIIFIDEIDAIAPKRDEVVGEVERRVVAQILALMDGIGDRGNVIVMAATNRVNSLDEALRRPGRFDREIEFGVPNADGRTEILQIHTRGMPIGTEGKDGKNKMKEDLIKKISAQTHGFVGADLEALCRESAMKALSRYLPEINEMQGSENEEFTIPDEVLDKLEVTKDDFNEALKEVQPSALREVSVQIPKVFWNEIGGLKEAKEELKKAVEWPLKHADKFNKMGIKPIKGVLLYGPPGCGKTLLAKAVATESQANFISVKGPELLSMYVGESEKAIRKIFRKARQVSPAIIFFDEIDSIAPKRGGSFDSGVSNRVLDQLLTEIDGITQLKNVVFIAATNRPDLVDQALLRSGRTDKIIKVDSPDVKTREEILKVHSKNVPLAEDVSLKELARITEGFSGADLEGLIRDAAMLALEEQKFEVKDVSMDHFLKVIEKIKGSLTEKVKKVYDEFEEHRAEFTPSYVG